MQGGSARQLSQQESRQIADKRYSGKQMHESYAAAAPERRPHLQGCLIHCQLTEALPSICDHIVGPIPLATAQVEHEALLSHGTHLCQGLLSAGLLSWSP